MISKDLFQKPQWVKGTIGENPYVTNISQWLNTVTERKEKKERKKKKKKRGGGEGEIHNT